MTRPTSNALACRSWPTPGTMIGIAGLLLMLLGTGLPAQASTRARLEGLTSRDAGRAGEPGLAPGGAVPPEPSTDT